MEIEDFYIEFKQDLLIDGHAVQVRVERLKAQLFQIDKGNPDSDWYDLEEDRIHQENRLLLIKRRRKYLWDRFEGLNDEIQGIKKSITDEMKNIERDLAELSK